MHACDGGAEPDPRHRYCYTYSTNQLGTRELCMRDGGIPTR